MGVFASLEKSESPGAVGAKVTKEDIFYHVVGVLHSPEYRARFASDLKKMLPRIPFTRETADFRRFSQAGQPGGGLNSEADSQK